MSKESGNVTYRHLVKSILSFHPEFKNPLNKESFSEFVIARVIGDFMNDREIKGDHDKKLKKAEDIYKAIIEAYDKILEEEKESKNEKQTDAAQ